MIVERFYFYEPAQSTEESWADYLAELRRLARTCDFGNGESTVFYIV